MANIFSHYKEVNEMIHGDELEDLDAPLKVLIEGREYVVTGTDLQTNEEDDTQVVWLSVVEE